jgi:5-methylcytosine-specific restriction protein A
MTKVQDRLANRAGGYSVTRDEVLREFKIIRGNLVLEDEVLDSYIQNTDLWPDDLPQGQTYFEGLAQHVYVNRYERSVEARIACIAHHGCICQVCRLDFGARYGALGAGFIHVHHVRPVSSIGGVYRVDPVVDLVPVCPNCHAMLHRHNPPLTVEGLRALLI